MISFQYSLRIVGFRDDDCGRGRDGHCAFQYSLRIVGFRDWTGRLLTRRRWSLSVFPANRGVPRHKRHGCFSCFVFLSVFPANRGVPRPTRIATSSGRSCAFSIPCESWGSATRVFVAFVVVNGTIFQYSLRIVGFRDEAVEKAATSGSSLSVFPANRGVPRRLRDGGVHAKAAAFSIPCESWGSATGFRGMAPGPLPAFQYSLRIVGFRDLIIPGDVYLKTSFLSVFPANRGVPRLSISHNSLSILSHFQYSLRIVGFRDTVHCIGPLGKINFQYSLRIVGFRDCGSIGGDFHLHVALSVFPANRGVPRLRIIPV